MVGKNGTEDSNSSGGSSNPPSGKKTPNDLMNIAEENGAQISRSPKNRTTPLVSPNNNGSRCGSYSGPNIRGARGRFPNVIAAGVALTGARLSDVTEAIEDFSIPSIFDVEDIADSNVIGNPEYSLPENIEIPISDTGVSDE